MKMTWKDYLPIIYIYIFSFLISLNLTFYFTLNLRTFVLYFLGIFALIFAVLKLIKLQGFVDSFVAYDFISKKIRFYAYVFPFFELLFAISFLIKFEIIWLEAFCFFFYFLNLISMINALLKKQKFVCACLGGLFMVPLSYVALMENITMLLGIAYLFWIR